MDVDLLKLFNVLDFPCETHDVLPEKYKTRVIADEYNKHSLSDKSLLINFMENSYFDKQQNSVGPWAPTNHKIKDGQISLDRPCFMANIKIHNATYAKLMFDYTNLPFVKIGNVLALPDCTKYNPLYNMGSYNPTTIHTDGDSITYDILCFYVSDIHEKFDQFVYKHDPVITYRRPSQKCAIIKSADLIEYGFNNNFIYTRCTEFIQKLLVFLNKKISNKYLLLEIVNNGVKPKWLTDHEIFSLL